MYILCMCTIHVPQCGYSTKTIDMSIWLGVAHSARGEKDIHNQMHIKIGVYIHG